MSNLDSLEILVFLGFIEGGENWLRNKVIVNFYVFECKIHCKIRRKEKQSLLLTPTGLLDRLLLKNPGLNTLEQIIYHLKPKILALFWHITYFGVLRPRLVKETNQVFQSGS